MTQQIDTQEYVRFNIVKSHYIEALQRNAGPEELHSYLRDLLREAIKMNITLIDLLKILSGSDVKESDTEMFINNVSKLYAQGLTAAKIKNDEAKNIQKAEKKNKQRPY